MADYIDELNSKLEASRKRLRQGREMKMLKQSAPTLFEIIDGEITLAVNRAFANTPLSYEDYLSVHGEVKGIRRIRNLIDAREVEEVQASQEVAAIENQIKQFKDDKKQQ